MRLAARRSAVQAATDAQRQLHALVVAAPDPLRGRLRGLTTPRLVSTCGRLRQRATWEVETAATVASLRALAHRIQLLNSEVAEHTRAITTLVRVWRPDLLGCCGVGPIVDKTLPGPLRRPPAVPTAGARSRQPVRGLTTRSRTGPRPDSKQAHAVSPRYFEEARMS